MWLLFEFYLSTDIDNIIPYWGKEVAKTGGRKLRRQLADNEWQPRPD